MRYVHITVLSDEFVYPWEGILARSAPALDRDTDRQPEHTAFDHDVNFACCAATVLVRDSGRRNDVPLRCHLTVYVVNNLLEGIASLWHLSSPVTDPAERPAFVRA